MHKICYVLYFMFVLSSVHLQGDPKPKKSSPVLWSANILNWETKHCTNTPDAVSILTFFWPEHFFRCVHHPCMCWLNDTHLMGPLSLVSCLLLHVDAGACFIWRIDVLLLSINMASAANELCISVDLWFQRLPLFVVTICNNNFVLHLPEVAAFCTLSNQLQSVYSFILCHAP